MMISEMVSGRHKVEIYSETRDCRLTGTWPAHEDTGCSPTRTRAQT